VGRIEPSPLSFMFSFSMGSQVPDACAEGRLGLPRPAARARGACRQSVDVAYLHPPVLHDPPCRNQRAAAPPAGRLEGPYPAGVSSWSRTRLVQWCVVLPNTALQLTRRRIEAYQGTGRRPPGSGRIRRAPAARAVYIHGRRAAERPIR
jgi:hypothetical protein